jgi:hypothetical protein
MTMQQLLSDLAEVKKALPSAPLASSDDIATYLKHNLIPFIEAHVAETAEMDEALANLVEHEADLLHEETAAVFVSLIMSGREVARELAARMGNDQRLHKLLTEFRELCKQGEEILNEVTVEDPDAESEPEQPEQSGPPSLSAAPPEVKTP